LKVKLNCLFYTTLLDETISWIGVTLFKNKLPLIVGTAGWVIDSAMQAYFSKPVFV